jgi:hypothetical protein
MTGIMTAVAGNAQNVLYAPGLYIVETSTVQQSPISDSASATGPSQSILIVRNWIGYFLPNTTGSVDLNIQVSASAGTNASASTTGRLWLGDNAIAGSNTQADITISRTSGSGISTATFNLISNTYYPLRIRWNGSYSGGQTSFPSASLTTASGSILFSVNLSSNVSGRIFYNTVSPPGF